MCGFHCPANIHQHPPVKPFVKLCCSSRALSKQLLSLNQCNEAPPVCTAKVFLQCWGFLGCIWQVVPDWS